MSHIFVRRWPVLSLRLVIYILWSKLSKPVLFRSSLQMSLDDICLFLKWYLWLGAVGDLRSFYKDINSVYLFKSTALSDTFRQRMLKKKKDKGNVYLTNISTFHGKIIHKQFLLSEIIFKKFSIHLIFILFLDFQCCSTKALQYIIRTALNILYSQVLLATA